MPYIDLNSDLGEHPDSSLDEQIMPFLSSCNIACGGHVGDSDSVEQAVILAKQCGVAIGAHPSYPDKENFGRTVIDIPAEELASSLSQQIALVRKVCNRQNVPLHHVKPHGALYNQAAKDAKLSELICKVIKKIDPSLNLYGLAHSISATVAKEQDIAFVAEGFADRKYEPNKTLTSRKKEGAVLTDEAEVLQQVEEMAVNHRVYASGWLALEVQTLCLHSDTQGAVNLAEKIRNHLESKGVHIVSV